MDSSSLRNLTAKALQAQRKEEEEEDEDEEQDWILKLARATQLAEQLAQ